MTVLGEAFIEVRADLGPFIRNLDKEVKKAADAIEKRLGDSVTKGLGGTDVDGERLGERLGDGVGKGMGRKLGDKGKPPWTTITAAFASALDDGISALPTEVKIAIVGGIILAIPLVSAALAGAVAAGLGVGLAGVGVLIASQFQEVEDEAKLTADLLRDSFTRAGDAFGLATIQALELVQNAVLAIESQLGGIFDNAATFLEPLTRGILDAFGFIADSIDAVDEKLGPFVDELAKGIGLLGSAIGEAFEILVNTGEEGQEGLRDLLYAVSGLIVGTAQLLAIFTELYGFVRDVAKAVPFLFGPLPFLIKESDALAASTEGLGQTTSFWTNTVDAAVKATKEEEKALKAAAKAMDTMRDAAFASVDANIAYEASLDDLRDALSENGKTLAFETEEGRENLRAFGDAIKDAQKRAEDRFQKGQLNAQQAQQFYESEIQQILKIARAHGVTESALRNVYGEAIKLVNLPEANTGWLGKLSSAAAQAASQLERGLNAATKLNNLGGKGYGGFTGFAEGGIIDQPTMALMGEAGPEVVIPLTRPARAAELMAMSGLDKMLQPATPTVNVFVGNEQLDARTYRIVTENNEALSNSLSFGVRGL